MPDSMRELFRQHHRLTDSERSTLWDKCVFVPDTNVLLNVYRYADATREDLFNVLASVNDRVWVPYQVAKEYYNRRIDVIQEQRSKYDELILALNKAIDNLREFQKSAFLKIDDVEQIIKPKIEEAIQAVEKRKSGHPDLIKEDPYRDRLVGILNTSVGIAPADTIFEQRCKLAQSRIDSKRPPGFKDAAKPTPDRYGDVLIWLEILEYAQAAHKPIAFITDDGKEDWWQIIKGEKLGPRPELREELLQHAKVDFYLCSPAYFLETIGSSSRVTVSQASVEDAKTVSAELLQKAGRFQRAIDFNFDRDLGDSISLGDSASCIEAALEEWMLREWDVAISKSSGAPIDFVVHQQGERIAISIKLVSDAAVKHVGDILGKAERVTNWATKLGFSNYVIVIVSLDERTAFEVEQLVIDSHHEITDYSVLIGFLNKKNRFHPTVRINWICGLS